MAPRYRSTVVGSRGLASTSHPLASLAGVDMLMRGGTAVDAAIAANAVLAVTQNHLCGLGGDIFYLLWMAERSRVEFVNGSGRAAQQATIEFYRSNSLDTIPTFGSLACITVPGCVDGWATIHERYGARPWHELFDHAIHHARNGFPVSHGLSRSIQAATARFAKYDTWGSIYLPRGRVPQPGERLVQNELAGSLERIAKGGRNEFYVGRLAHDLLQGVQAVGGLLSGEDFARHHSDWADPVYTRYREWEVYETAPPSQAATVLLWMNILEGFDLSKLPRESVELLHLLWETKKIAYEDRDRHIGDPAFMDIPVARLVAKDYARERRQLFGPDRVLPVGVPATPPLATGGDTSYLCVVDRWGNAVSCIQSNYMGFGSGIVPEGTGIGLQNRGAYFTLDPRHHNRLEPGKRTFHTLCASLALRNGQPALLFGAMGGDGQPQTHVQVMVDLFDYGLDIQEAIEAARWVNPGTIYQPEAAVHVESRYPEAALAALRANGHVIQVEPPFTSMMGHAQGIVLREGGRLLLGGADPRGDGAAIGY